jgi:hypothetical protein
MSPNEIAQFIEAVVGVLDLGPKLFKDLLGSIAEKLNQDVILVFKVQIDRSVSNASLFGDLGNRRLMKPLARKHGHGRFQYQVILIVFLMFSNFSASG